MTTYTLKLVSGVNYNLYEGTTLVSDSDLATLFGSAGEAYFVFDFNSGTPTNTTDLTIVDSNSQAVITNTGLSGIAEDVNFKGEWSASATAFDSFVKLGGVAMDEAQLSDLMGKIKSMGGGDVTEVSMTGNLNIESFITKVGTYRVTNTTSTTYYLKTGTSNVVQIRGGGTATLIANLAPSNTYQTETGYSGILISSNTDNGNKGAGTITQFCVGNYKKSLPVFPATNALNVNDESSPLSARAGMSLAASMTGGNAMTPNLPSARAWTTIGTTSAYTKRALQVTVNISETSLTLTADDWNTLFTLPSGFRPTIAMEGTVSVLDSGVIETSYVKVNTDGTVQVRAFGSTTEVHGSIVFPVSS